MTREVAVLRPKPGNARTVGLVKSAGLAPISLPLFTVRPLPWRAPDPAAFDGLLATSANAFRYGGLELTRLACLPVLAVGSATAAAARAAGFTVALTGVADANSLMTAANPTRLLRLAGREHVTLAGPDTRIVYSADEAQVTPDAVRALAGTVALLHSARAAGRLSKLADEVGIRDSIRVAAFSPAVLAAAGTGWDAAVAAEQPRDDALVALASRLAD